MKRRVIYLDAAAERALAEQMKAHGVKNASALIRARLVGYSPGCEPGTDAARAAAWWDLRSPARKVSIWRYHSTTREPEPDLAQIPLIDV